MELKTGIDHVTEAIEPPRFDDFEMNYAPFNRHTATQPRLTDKELWINFKNGDKKALSIIYSTTITSLLNYGQKFIADKEVVADLIQDLFIELWNQRERLSDTTSIKYYLLKSLRYKIIRHCNRNKNLVVKNGISDNYNFELVFSHENKLIEDVSVKEQKEKLEQALSKLTKRQKEAIYLRYYNNLSYTEISSLMSLSEQSAYNLISKALKMLQKLLLQHIYLFLLVYCMG
jgi:RNA polymerase sigma factor (sigma-70 family)